MLYSDDTNTVCPFMTEVHVWVLKMLENMFSTDDIWFDSDTGCSSHIYTFSFGWCIVVHFYIFVFGSWCVRLVLWGSIFCQFIVLILAMSFPDYFSSPTFLYYLLCIAIFHRHDLDHLISFALTQVHERSHNILL